MTDQQKTSFKHMLRKKVMIGQVMVLSPTSTTTTSTTKVTPTTTDKRSIVAARRRSHQNSSDVTPAEKEGIS